MPHIAIENAIELGSFQIVPNKNLHIITLWKAIWLKAKTLSLVAEAYLDFLKEHKDQIVNSNFAQCDKY